MLRFSCAIISAILSLSASAESHRYVRLDDEHFSMHHVAVRDQGQIGDCYAHAAAQFYDAWRFKLEETDYTRQSSGIEMNQRFKWYRGDTDIDGGKLAKIVPALSKVGTCAESDLNALFRGMTVDQYGSAVMKIYNDQSAAFDKEVDPLIAGLPRPHSPIQFVLWERMKKEIEAEHLPKFLNEGTEKLKELHRRVLTFKYDESRLTMLMPDRDKLKDVVGIFATLWPITCPTKRMKSTVPFKVENESHYGWSWSSFSWRFFGSDTLARIHGELDYHMDAMPIGISYCSKVLKEGLAYKTRSPNTDECGRHASLIIGRRTHPDHPERRQLLVRNTWGKYCGSAYSPDWTCEADKGSIWVDESALARAIFETQVFVRK